MKNTKILFAFIFITLVFTTMSWGHGIKLSLEKQSPLIVTTATYHGGQGLKDAKVSVFLESETKPFKEGITDQNGSFSFTPQSAGKYRIIIDDQTGHRKEGTIEIDSSFLPSPAPQSTPQKEIPGTIQPGKETGKETAPKPPAEPVAKSEFSGYLIKIALGVILILLITYIMNKLVKKQEAQEKK